MSSLSQSTRFAWTALLVSMIGVYLYNAPYFTFLNNPNENVRVYMTRSIVEEGTFAIDSVIAEWGYVNDKATFEGRMYPGKAPGVSYLGVPAYWVHYRINQAIGRTASKHEVVTVCRIGGQTLPLLAFLLWFARFTRRVGDDPAVRMLGVLALAFGSTVLTYGGMFASHSLVAACLFGAYMLRFYHAENARAWWAPFGIGFLLATALGLEYPGALGGAVVGLYSLYRSPARVRFFCWSALGMVIPLGLVFLFHWKAFGGPMELPYSHLENPEFVEHVTGGFFGLERIQPEALHGSFFAPSNGLFWFLPWTMIPFVGLVFSLHFERLREPAIVTLGVLLAYTAFIAMVDNWRGGWTAGPRYIVPVVPFLAWYLIVFIAELRRTELGVPVMVLALGLTAASMFNCGLSAAMFPHYPEGIENPIFEIAVFLLQRGYAPHSLATALGAAGPTSLLPLAVLFVIALVATVASIDRLSGVERTTVGTVAVAAAALFVALQSVPVTTNGAFLRQTQATVADLWEPVSDEGYRLLRLGAYDSDIRYRRADAETLRRAAAAAARRGMENTAAQLYEAALRVDAASTAPSPVGPPSP